MGFDEIPKDIADSYAWTKESDAVSNFYEEILVYYRETDDRKEVRQYLVGKTIEIIGKMEDTDA